MKERPILFSAPMVRSILDGEKTVTRRVVKHKITGPNPPTGIFDWHHPRTDEWMGAHGGGIKFGLTNAARLCPYGQPDDRLWVRETWQHSNHPFGPLDKTCTIFYRADYSADPHGMDGEKSPEGKYRQWRPSIHMPRWASRILLEIVSVRVERLQEISGSDAVAEGLRFIPWDEGEAYAWRDDDRIGSGNAVFAYRDLWESINGPGSWDTNPWVWVVEFKRIQP